MKPQQPAARPSTPAAQDTLPITILPVAAGLVPAAPAAPPRPSTHQCPTCGVKGRPYTVIEAGETLTCVIGCRCRRKPVRRPGGEP